MGKGEKEIITCLNCGKQVEDYKSRHRKYCCKKCQYEHFQKIHDYYKIKKCKYCGKEFRVKENRNIFCSRECSRKYNKQFSYSCNTRKCEWCGIEYYPKSRGQRYCSKKCGYEWYSKFKRTGEQIQHQIDVVLNLAKEGRTKKAFTKPHVMIDELLDQMSIVHNDEYNIKYYSIDIYLPDSNLMIEIMGDYWHTNPVSKFREPKNDVQKQRISKDRAKHTYVKNKYGIEILYLWESDIYNYIDICKELILLYINKKGILDNYNSYNYLIIDDKLELGEIVVQPLFLLDNTA